MLGVIHASQECIKPHYGRAWLVCLVNYHGFFFAGMNDSLVTICSPHPRFTNIIHLKRSKLLVINEKKKKTSGECLIYLKSRPVFTYHSYECSRPYFPIILKFECDTTSNWLNQLD